MIRIFYMSFVALFCAMAVNSTPAVAGAAGITIEIDCNHSKLDKTSTKDILAVEFYDGTKLVASHMSYGKCTSTKDAEFKGLFGTAGERDAVDSVQIKTNGTDALFIDELKFGSKGFGQDNGKGWCLSKNKSDGTGKWKNYVDQSFGCHSCLKFVYSSKKVYSCD